MFIRNSKVSYINPFVNYTETNSYEYISKIIISIWQIYLLAWKIILSSISEEVLFSVTLFHNSTIFVVVYRHFCNLVTLNIHLCIFFSAKTKTKCINIRKPILYLDRTVEHVEGFDISRVPTRVAHLARSAGSIFRPDFPLSHFFFQHARFQVLIHLKLHTSLSHLRGFSVNDVIFFYSDLDFRQRST